MIPTQESGCSAGAVDPITLPTVGKVINAVMPKDSRPSFHTVNRHNLLQSIISHGHPITHIIPQGPSLAGADYPSSSAIFSFSLQLKGLASRVSARCMTWAHGLLR